jgi:hypothetical protein
VLRAITGRKTQGRSVATAGGARELQKLRAEDLQGGRRMGAVTLPDLALFLYKNRIVYLGICLVLSVTELMLAEVLYFQYEDAEKTTSTCTSTPLAPPRFDAQLTTRIHIFLATGYVLYYC